MQLVVWLGIMTYMKRLIILFLSIILISNNLFSQERKGLYHNIGINLLQIPATTIDLSYEISKQPSYSLIINTGYTLDYTKSFDFIGFILSPHYKGGNDGYIMKYQKGGFFKLGLRYKFRNTVDKKDYFFLTAFLTNALIYEKSEYTNWDNISNSQVEELKHRIFIFGL